MSTTSVRGFFGGFLAGVLAMSLLLALMPLLNGQVAGLPPDQALGWSQANLELSLPIFALSLLLFVGGLQRLHRCLREAHPGALIIGADGRVRCESVANPARAGDHP